MMAFPYDTTFVPPAPLLEVDSIHPETGNAERMRFMIDSRAYMSVVPDSVVARLALQRVGIADVAGFGSATRAWVYATLLQVPGTGAPGLGRVLSWSRPYGLLGRELLNGFRVVLDGPRFPFTLEGVPS